MQTVFSQLPLNSNPTSCQAHRVEGSSGKEVYAWLSFFKAGEGYIEQEKRKQGTDIIIHSSLLPAENVQYFTLKEV